MCTLACWIGRSEEMPLLVAANRDEKLGRPSSGPAIREHPRRVAPLDEVAGGTWWALGAGGLFVGLTNRAGAFVDDHRRSRGLLVEDVAGCGTVDRAEALLSRLAASDYNGFHLIATDGRSGVLVVSDGVRQTTTPLMRGFHLVSERSFGAAETTRDARAAQLLAEAVPDPVRIAAVLASHEAPTPFDALCVHVPEWEYGTRSSTILALGAKPTLLYAPGPPCRTPFEDRSALVEELLRA